MFGRTAAPQNGAPTGQKMSERSATFSSVVASFWRVATLKSSLGAARHSPALRRGAVAYLGFQKGGALPRKFVRFLPENGAFWLHFLPYARFFRSSKGGAWPKWPNGKYACGEGGTPYCEN